MSSMTMDSSISPTIVRPVLKLSMIEASDWFDCSTWVDSCTPDVAVPLRPMNPLVMPDARSMLARESSISL